MQKSISVTASVNSLLISLSIYWLLASLANEGPSSAAESSSQHWAVPLIQELANSKITLDSSTAVIKFAEGELHNAISNSPQNSFKRSLLKKLQNFCVAYMRSPLLLATRLSLAFYGMPLGPSFVVLRSSVGLLAQQKPKWGLLSGDGKTPLATVCYFIPPSQSRKERSYSSSSLPVSIMRELSRYSPAALFCADSLGMLPLQAAIKHGSLDVAKFIYRNFPQAVPLVDNDNRSSLYYALAGLSEEIRGSASAALTEDEASEVNYSSSNTSSSSSAQLGDNCLVETAIGACVMDLLHLYPAAVDEILQEGADSKQSRLLDRVRFASSQSQKMAETAGTGVGKEPSVPEEKKEVAVEEKEKEKGEESRNLSQSESDGEKDKDKEREDQSFSAVGALLFLKTSNDR